MSNFIYQSKVFKEKNNVEYQVEIDIKLIFDIIIGLILLGAGSYTTFITFMRMFQNMKGQ